MSTNQKLYIKKNSRIHSSGLFAKTDIKSGTRIIEPWPKNNKGSIGQDCRCAY